MQCNASGILEAAMSCPRKDERWKKYHVPKSGAGVLQIARFTDSILISLAERRLLQLSTRSFEAASQPDDQWSLA